MGPVKEGISESARNGTRPREKFFKRRCVSGAETFRDAVGTHGAPFVMVAGKPDVGEIRKFAICGDVGYGKMGVVIEDRLALCNFGITLPRRFRVWQDILV